MIKPEELRSWIEQVQDEDTSVEDYDFLDRVTHQGSRNNGNNGLANAGAYLAIYRNGSGLEVDEELVQELDRRQADNGHSGEKRFSNIVYDATSEKREGKTLYDRGVDGHQVLEIYIGQFESNAQVDSSLSDDENILKVNTQNQNSDNTKGGDNTMATKQDIQYAADTLDGTRRRNEAITGDVVDAVDTLVSYVGDVQSLEAERDGLQEDYIESMRSFQSYLDKQSEALDESSQNVEYVNQVLDDIDLNGLADTDDMQDGFRNASF